MRQSMSWYQRWAAKGAAWGGVLVPVAVAAGGAVAYYAFGIDVVSALGGWGVTGGVLGGSLVGGGVVGAGVGAGAEACCGTKSSSHDEESQLLEPQDYEEEEEVYGPNDSEFQRLVGEFQKLVNKIPKAEQADNNDANKTQQKQLGKQITATLKELDTYMRERVWEQPAITTYQDLLKQEREFISKVGAISSRSRPRSMALDVPKPGNTNTMTQNAGSYDGNAVAGSYPPPMFNYNQ